MRCALLAFAAGIAIVQALAVLPTPLCCAVLAVLALILMSLLLCFPAASPLSPTTLLPARSSAAYLLSLPAIRILSLAICALLTGFSWAAFCAQERLNDRLLPEWEGRNITLIGTVDNLPTSSIRGRHFLFAVEQVMSQNGVMPQVPTRLSLAWYAGRAGIAAVPEITPGARWQFTVRLTRPHGNANPHGFDNELRMLEHGIGAAGYVRIGAATPTHLLDVFVFSPSHLLQRARAYLQRKILTALPNAPHAGVIVALVIGEQRAIEKTDWEVFRRSGVNHLVAISGLHIMMVAGLFGRLMLALWRRSFWMPERFAMPLPLYLPAQKAAMLVALLAATSYVALAGFGIPAQRALYMLAVLAAAFWLGRISSPPYILCMALAVVLLLDPWALLWPGFHLSFAAVGIILYAGVGRTRSRDTQEREQDQPSQYGHQGIEPKTLFMRGRKILQTLVDGSRTQWAVSLGLLPLTMLLFAQYSLISPLANAVAIPVVTLVVVPLALLGAVLPVPLAEWALLAAHAVFVYVFDWLDWLSKLSVAVWEVPLPGWTLFLIALIGTLLMLAPRGWPLRWIGLFGWLPLLFNAPSHPAAGEMWVTAFDVGQGMALLLETAQHRLIYDTGPTYGPAADAGDRVILPYLHARGISSLDALVVSHGDSDHAGGALSILRTLPVTTVYSSLPPGHRIIKAAAQHLRCMGNNGQRWQWDGIAFEMLYPTSVNYASAKWSANARSCVLKVTAGAHSILLAGDIGKAQETELLNNLGADRLRATVLLAPHHGSKTSSSVAFLWAVDPALAIFQVGYRNRFHHPQVKVYQRYHELGIHRLRTDVTGAITLQFGTTLQYQAYRQQHARYWRLITEPND